MHQNRVPLSPQPDIPALPEPHFAAVPGQKQPVLSDTGIPGCLGFRQYFPEYPYPRRTHPKLAKANGLQSISKDYYEAAELDGAGRWKQFRYITLPALKPILTTVLILDCVWWFKQYTLVYTMTAGGPGTATSLISLSIYGTAFNDLRFGKASAWGILVFVICYLINLVSKVVMKDDE